LGVSVGVTALSLFSTWMFGQRGGGPGWRRCEFSSHLRSHASNFNCGPRSVRSCATHSV